jgi:hypothetical protein
VTVTFSVITWYDWHVLRRSVVDKGVPGFLIDNWYLLLMVVLLVALPIRAAPGAAGERAPVTVEGREVVASDHR